MAEMIIVSSLVFIVSVIVALGIYYLFSRKNIKKQHAYFEQLHKELSVGNKVVFSNGLYGKVKRINDETVDIEIAKGVAITVSRFSISEIIH
ncbi:preprotein translocase subunit YajC [Granulicatella balaenopterae]|uniref:Preprotein translocase subunit YajC n=1 Tax=Granulicatella balaenopterae TaxID=137733 RepID=A0A1H9LTE6_9LACT|nr:preprotein translocase subunit YajC [Granulicatella balaenopterae]SER14731.1 preprotein translocase subunit YajC [Granulicatella balaenopterae]